MNTAQHTHAARYFQDTETLEDVYGDSGVSAGFPDDFTPQDNGSSEPLPTVEEEEQHRQHYLTGRVAELSSFILMLTVGAARKNDPQLDLCGANDHAEYYAVACEELARRGQVVPAEWPALLAR